MVPARFLGLTFAAALAAQLAISIAASAQPAPVSAVATAKASRPASRAAVKKKPTARPSPTRASPARISRPTRVSRYAPVELFHINRRETMRLRLYDERGRTIPGVQKRIERFLRCHHTNKQHRIDPRLVRLIFETGHAYPGRRVEVISGYRHPSVARNPKSPHMKGLACDLRVVGVKNSELRDYLRRRFQRVGIGYYPNSAFVHLDVRKDKSAFWIDYSGPGQAAAYAEKPFEDLRTGRADTFRPGTSAVPVEPGAGAEGEADVPTLGSGAVESPSAPGALAGDPAATPAAGTSPQSGSIPGGGGPRAGQ